MKKKLSIHPVKQVEKVIKTRSKLHRATKPIKTGKEYDRKKDNEKDWEE